jgi:hypothetical protein
MIGHAWAKIERRVSGWSNGWSAMAASGTMRVVEKRWGMAGSVNKTQPNQVSLDAYLATVAPPERRADADALIDLFGRVSGAGPVMWGPSIIGFGEYHYRYDSGREGDMARIAFSPRKAELVLYVGAGNDRIAPLLAGLGNHRTGKGCLYVKRLAGIDMAVLEAVVRQAWANSLAAYPG